MSSGEPHIEERALLLSSDTKHDDSDSEVSSVEISVARTPEVDTEHSIQAEPEPIRIKGPSPSNNTEEEDDEEDSFEDHASIVLTIMKPVALTMIFVIWAVRTIDLPGRGSVSQAMVYHENASDSSGTKLLGSIVNALIFLGIILLTTVVFVILYKYRCMKLIFAWLFLSTGMMLGMFGGYIFYLILVAYNLAMDYITFSFLLWNFGVVGIIAIFWKAPMKVQQGYLIAVSALLAIYLTRFPEWTTWAILAVVAVYDIFAVLCPKGPLKVLVETAQQRQEPIPALLYNTMVWMMNVDTDITPSSSKTTNTTANTTTTTTTTSDDHDGHDDGHDIEQAHSDTPQPEKRRGVKLGLGDFVFYSVLVGRAALFDMITVFTCFFAVITGLFFTLICLAIFRRALPALPFSIGLGIIFYLLTRVFVLPFVITLGTDQIFI